MIEKEKFVVISVIIIVILVLATLFILSQGTLLRDDENKLIGTWKCTNDSSGWRLTFYSDGTCKSENPADSHLTNNGTYEVNPLVGGKRYPVGELKIIKTVGAGNFQGTFIYYFSDNYNKLNLWLYDSEYIFFFTKQ